MNPTPVGSTLAPQVGGSCGSLPNIDNANPGNCVANSAAGTTCTPICNTGYNGTLSATCNSGIWATTGVCLAPVGSNCSALPVVVNANPGNCSSGAPHGSTCVPVCASGFFGSLSATCNNGAWANFGVCASLSCDATPEIPNGNSGDCVAGSSNGTTCTPTCNSDFIGNISAMCDSKSWIVSGNCAPSSGGPTPHYSFTIKFKANTVCLGPKMEEYVAFRDSTHISFLGLTNSCVYM